MEFAQAKRAAEKYEEKFNRCIELTKRMLIEKCEHDKREARRRSMEDRLRLGDWSSYRNYNVSTTVSIVILSVTVIASFFNAKLIL